MVVTEGELDALSVSQAQDHKWPVVSLKNGAGSEAKALKEALPWLLGFDKVVLWFDNDEPGRKAVEKARTILPPGKCWVAKTPEGFKDANDLLVAGKTKEIIDTIWNAKQHRPDGVVAGSKVLERLKARPEVTSYPYPSFFSRLNDLVYGIRLGELDIWTSGTGMGKTTIIKELQWHFMKATDMNQALIHLEEPLEDTATSFMSLALDKRLHLPDVRETIDPSEIDKAAEDVFMATDANGNPRIQLYDAFGSVEDESLYDVIRYMASGLGCKIVWLDHLSILVSDMGEDGDERRRIDSIMHKLKLLTQELGIYIGLISHLRSPTGGTGTFETGRVPSLDDLRGSRGIKQLANSVFALSRNQQAEDPVERNSSTVTVLKCRFTGRTGTADTVHFNQSTGRLEAVEAAWDDQGF